MEVRIHQNETKSKHLKQKPLVMSAWFVKKLLKKFSGV